MDNLAFLEQMARRLDELDIPNILMVGQIDDDIETMMKEVGCVTTWVKTLKEAQEVIDSQNVKLIFILGAKAVGVSLVQWLTMRGLSVPVVFLENETSKKKTEVSEEYPVINLNCRDKASRIKGLVKGFHHTGMALN